VPAILLEQVSKRFRKVVLRTGYTTLKTSLTRRFTGEAPRLEHVEALSGVTLAVPRGATLGVIGRNGSGKSTLIRLMAGIYTPDSGRVATEGRVSALIELGAGFHPEFTGRENIFINGIILGLTRKQIHARFDEIVQFAGLEDFVDSPVRTYSSGMYMRLGFSVAVHVDPDILLVDEVLAVGDEAFVRKGLEKMDEFKEQGKTIVVAGHDLGMVERWCDAAILLEKGRVTAEGDPSEVVAAYRASRAIDDTASSPSRS
jgi:lipopolysaccharide transport system ATP-binding protein